MGYESRQEIIDDVRVFAGNIPHPGKGAAPDALGDEQIGRQLDRFISNEMSRFFPIYQVNTVVPTEGQRVFDLSAEDPAVRDVLAVYDQSITPIVTAGSPVDAIVAAIFNTRLQSAAEPSLWMVTWREIDQLKRVSRAHRFDYDIDRRQLYIRFDAAVGRNLHYLALVLRGSSDNEIKALPDDLDELIEQGTRLKVLKIVRTMRTRLGGFQRSGSSVDYGGGAAIDNQIRELETEVNDALRALSMRSSNRYPLTLGP